MENPLENPTTPELNLAKKIGSVLDAQYDEIIAYDEGAADLPGMQTAEEIKNLLVQAGIDIDDKLNIKVTTKRESNEANRKVWYELVVEINSGDERILERRFHIPGQDYEF